MKLAIEKDNVQKLLDYLASRPFSEVYQVIPLLMNLPTIIEAPSQTTPLAQEPQEEQLTQPN